MNLKKVLSERRYKAGYVVRRELIDGSDWGNPDIEIKRAYTPDGAYIGSSKQAYRLCKVRGIQPEDSRKEAAPMTSRTQHIIRHKGKWAVRPAGSRRPSLITEDLSEAVLAAKRRIAKEGKVIVHKGDGTKEELSVRWVPSSRFA